VPSVIYDKLSGQTIAYAVMAGLVQSARSGKGTSIEVPMFETAVEFNLVEHMSGSAFVPPLGRMGASRVLTTRRKPYRTVDGHVCILPYSDRNWQDFFDFAGLEDCRVDPRYTTLAGRAEHADALYTQVEAAALKRTTAEWVDFGDRLNVPCMAVVRLDELADDAHIKSIGMFEEVDHPTEGRYLSVRPPVSFTGHEFLIRHHAPRLGQDTASVLREVGLPPEQIAALTSRTGPPSAATGRGEPP
jgi:crotonobetainyl-CoA:carnitine CoA-transferase CaiB-like acyl-CoA transferase